VEPTNGIPGLYYNICTEKLYNWLERRKPNQQCIELQECTTTFRGVVLLAVGVGNLTQSQKTPYEMRIAHGVICPLLTPMCF
jgi:hypothetical protein